MTINQNKPEMYYIYLTDDQTKVDEQEVEKSSVKVDISYENLSEVIIRRCIFLLTCINGPENSWELRNEGSFKEDLTLNHSNKYCVSFNILMLVSKYFYLLVLMIWLRTKSNFLMLL